MNKRVYAYLQKDTSLSSPVGEPEVDRNVLVTDGNNLSLKKVGRINTQEQIQSHLDGVSLARMIERFKRGDDSALTVRSGFYGDVSGFSDDPAEVINNTRGLVDQQVAVQQDFVQGDVSDVTAPQHETVQNVQSDKEVVENAG